GVRFRDASRDSAHAGFRDELHADTCGRIHLLEVVNQLRQILDRIDVVMWRRRDQGYADDRVPQSRDEIGDLVPRQLAAFTGLRALRDLDLELVRPDEVRRRHAEAAGGDLFDPVVGAIAVRTRDVGGRVLAAFPRIRPRVYAIHRDRESRVRLGRQRAERHGAGDKPAPDVFGTLDLGERHRRLDAET